MKHEFVLKRLVGIFILCGFFLIPTFALAICSTYKPSIQLNFLPASSSNPSLPISGTATFTLSLGNLFYSDSRCSEDISLTFHVDSSQKTSIRSNAGTIAIPTTDSENNTHLWITNLTVVINGKTFTKTGTYSCGSTFTSSPLVFYLDYEIEDAFYFYHTACGVTNIRSE